MRAFRWFTALLFAVAVAAAAGPNGGRAYRNEAARVRSFEPPSGWQAAPQASYPRLLCAYTHGDGGRLTLVQQKVLPGTTAEALAGAAVPALTQQGYREIRKSGDAERARLDANLDGGRRFLKQLYVVDGGSAWVLSLVAFTVNQPLMARDFEAASRSLVIVPGAVPDGGTP
jgi:hypothetical protein